MAPLEAATVHLEAVMVHLAVATALLEAVMALLAVATAHQEATTQCQHQHHQTTTFHLALAMARQEAATVHQATATAHQEAATAHQATAMAHQEATTQYQHQRPPTTTRHLALATPSTPAAIDYRTTRAAN